MISNPYMILGVDRNASGDEIKKAYRSLSRKYHPDANINSPNLGQIEEKFKEIQQAYQQIMDERERGYSSSSSYSGFGGCSGQAQGGSQYAGEDALKMQAAANYINARHFTEALNVLSAVGTKSAQWYFLGALANAGIGNNINARSLAEQAAALEPANMQYRQFLQQLQFGGTWYSSMGDAYGRPGDGNGICFHLCLANLFCNCCCRPC